MPNRLNVKCHYTRRQQQRQMAAMYVWDAVMNMIRKGGDPDAGIEPGTPFEALPEDWICPECGVSKSEMISAVTRG